MPETASICRPRVHPSRPLLLVALGVLASARLASAQCPDGTPPPCGRAAGRAAASPARAALPNSVAVLYFENVSRDSTDAYLTDGLTDEIILRLQQVQRLAVKSRYESRRVRGRRNAGPAVLGRDLGARYLVSGTIQRAGERIVVRVELTRADQGVGVWSERYDRTSADVLGVIDEVARGVATGVAGRLFPDEAAQVARRPTDDPEAYAHFLRGNFYLAQRNAVSLASAAAEYEQAMARDPHLQAALARVAYVYALGEAYGVGTLPAESVSARATRTGERAVREAPDVADTWLARGFLLLVRSVRAGGGDFIYEGVAALARAARMDPLSSEAHHQYAQGLILVSRDSSARAEYHRALELEPGRAVTYQELAVVALLEGGYAESVSWADSALGADPRLVWGHVLRAIGRLWTRDVPGARADADAALTLAPADQLSLAARAMVLAAMADTAAAVRVLPRGSLVVIGPEPALFVGQTDVGLAMIESFPSPAVRCYMVRVPSARRLRGDPRYDRLAAGCPRPEGVR